MLEIKYGIALNVTGNVGSVFTYWPSILRWNIRLKNSGYLVMKLYPTYSVSILNQCLDCTDFPLQKYVSLEFLTPPPPSLSALVLQRIMTA